MVIIKEIVDHPSRGKRPNEFKESSSKERFYYFFTSHVISQKSPKHAEALSLHWQWRTSIMSNSQACLRPLSDMCKRCPCGLLAFVAFKHIRNRSLMLSRTLLSYIYIYIIFRYTLFVPFDKTPSNDNASLKHYCDSTIIPMGSHVELAKCDTFYGRKTFAKTRYNSHGFTQRIIALRAEGRLFQISGRVRVFWYTGTVIAISFHRSLQNPVFITNWNKFN